MEMTAEQTKLYNFLIDYVTDKETVEKIIQGGEMGFLYGGAGYYTCDIDNLDKDFVNEQIAFGGMLLDDMALDNKYLIGSQL